MRILEFARVDQPQTMPAGLWEGIVSLSEKGSPKSRAKWAGQVHKPCVDWDAQVNAESTVDPEKKFILDICSFPATRDRTETFWSHLS